MNASLRWRILLWPLAVAVGIALFWLTNLVEPPLPKPFNFGAEYAAMAQDPFGLLGNFPHRILGPLLAHLLGLAGDRYALFAQGCMIALLALLFAAAVLRGAGLLPALVLTAAIAFTGTVQIYKGHLGYPDPITFALLTATLLASRRPVLFWTLMALNLANHEQIFFFWPWLLWWRRRDGAADWRHDAVGGALVAGLYVGWRYFVAAHAQQVMLTLDHYRGLDYFPLGTLGLSILNVASAFVFFGLLPVVICWHAFADGFRRAGFGILFWLASIFAIFAVAHDVYRFTCFLFVPLFFAGLRLLQQRHGAWLLFALGALSVVAIWLQKPVLVDLAELVLMDKDAPGGPKLREHAVLDIVPVVVPARPWTFAAYGLATLGSIAIGWLWARAQRRSK